MQVKVSAGGVDLEQDPRFRRWYEWALPNVAGDTLRAQIAAAAAVAALRAGADDLAAAAAAQRAAESHAAGVVIQRAASRRSWFRRLGPVVAVFAVITFVFGLLGGLLAAGALWVMERTWRAPLPAWLRGVLIAFTGLAALVFYVILTGILELVQRSGG